jgi:replicative DNA helicase
MSERQSNRLVPRDISESLGKLPPQALDMEQSVLGSILISGKERPNVLQILKPEHFYSDAHQEIYAAIVELVNQGNPVDLRTVANHLEKTGKLELVGGKYALVLLSDAVASAADMQYHALVVYEKYLLRQMIIVANEINVDAYDSGGDPHAIMEKFEKSIRSIHDNLPGGKEVHIKDELIKITNTIQKRTSEVEEITGIPTGFNQLDKILMGFQPGDLIIIAGRPSMGKTALAEQILLNVAVDFKMPVGMFSLEMPAYQVALRAASMTTGMNMKTLRTKMFNPLDWTNFIHKTAKLAGSPFYIDDTSALSIPELRARARRMVSRYGVKIIAIDYCQLMKGDSSYKNRNLEIGSITAACKGLAKELMIPVVLLSQLSRDVEKRGKEKIPILSDLRDSGSIEQDADVIIFPWRPGYYKIEGDSEGNFIPGLTKLIIAKNRNGELGEPFVKFINYLTAFENVEYAYEHQGPPDPPKNAEGQPLTPLPDNRIEPVDPEKPPF